MMQDIISAYTSGGKSIIINDEELRFEYTIPDVFPENFFYLLWWPHDGTYAYFTVDDLSDPFNQTKYPIEPTEENYNTYVKPFVDQWEEEKARIEAEEVYFPNRQKVALENLNEDFETAKERAHVKSSLGFEVDANQTANENVNGLLVTIGEGTVMFCDYNNEFHELNKSQLETLQIEIIQNAQNLYTQKWTFRNAIENCKDIEELDSTVADIEFTYMDFTPVSSEISGE